MIRDLWRTIRTIVAGLVLTVIAATSIIAATRRNAPLDRLERIIDFWSRNWLKAADVEMEVRGGDDLDPTQSYVMVSNHRSNLDIPVHFLAVPNPIRFLAKAELFRIPLLGPAMRSLGIVEVDRSRGPSIHRELNQHAAENLQHALSLMVYPEGTRSRDGSMRPFKKGAFAIAIANQLPVVPITTWGTYRAWPPKKLVKGGRVVCVIDPPIPTTGLSKADVGDLTERVRTDIVKRFEALDAECSTGPIS